VLLRVYGGAMQQALSRGHGAYVNCAGGRTASAGTGSNANHSASALSAFS